jgi:thiol-disulfide isomerase/thioredoxin
MKKLIQGFAYSVLTIGLVFVVSACTNTNSNTNVNSNSLTNIPEGTYDAFAKCLGEKGAKFYGAYWCPHCQSQKDMFGNAKKFLPYTECSDPNGKNSSIVQQVCRDANIKLYPTWQFPDGTRAVGEQSLSTLANKTGCQLPDTNQNTNQ